MDFPRTVQFLYAGPQPQADIDPRWAGVDFEAVNADIRSYQKQIARLRELIQPPEAGADGYVEFSARPESLKQDHVEAARLQTLLTKRHEAQRPSHPGGLYQWAYNALCSAPRVAMPNQFLIRARWPDGIESYLDVRGVYDLGDKIGIDVDAPDGHPLKTTKKARGCLSNCGACRHKRSNPDGGWCYMFRDEPSGVCHQWKGVDFRG